jgi:hypothetical protein
MEALLKSHLADRADAFGQYMPRFGSSLAFYFIDMKLFVTFQATELPRRMTVPKPHLEAHTALITVTVFRLIIGVAFARLVFAFIIGDEPCRGQPVWHE